MNKEAPVGTENQVRKLTYSESVRDVQRLISEFNKILDPKMVKLHNPSSRGSWRDLLNTQVAIDTATMSGKGIPPMAVWERGGITCKLLVHKNNLEIKTLALSAEMANGKGSELVALSLESEVFVGHGLNGETLVDSEITFDDAYILYARKSTSGDIVSKHVNDAEAVRRAKRVLGELKHPLLSSLTSLPFALKKAA